MRIINPGTISTPRGYNNGILISCGKILFVAGQVGWDKTEHMAEGLVNQFDLALQNVLEVVRTAGGNADNIGRFTLFIKDRQDYLAKRREIGAVYRKHMGRHFPAMSLLIVKDLLEEGALVEIEATAVIA